MPDQSALPSLKDYKFAAWTSPDVAQRYDRNTASTADYLHFLTGELVKELTRRLPAAAAVVDLGCGTGVLTLALAELGYEVTGLDVSQAMLDRIRAKAGERPIRLQQGDIFKLPFDAESFDGAVTRWVIPHFRDWPSIIKEAARVLRPGGILVFDHCSRAHYDMAERHGAVDYARFGWDPRTRDDSNLFYGAASIDEIRLAADMAGLTVQDVVPLGFFRQNAIIAAGLGPELNATFKETLDKLYQDAGVRLFMQWFDTYVTRHLPLEMTNGMAVVLQKGPQRA